MSRCEICGKEHAEVHHIVHKCEGGMDIEINYKYLCAKHHRGKYGPHKNENVDLKYKLELQEKLENLLDKEYCTISELQIKLSINKNKAKKIVKGFKRYKEGYKTKEIIYRLMGNNNYSLYEMFNCDEYVALNLA